MGTFITEEIVILPTLVKNYEYYDSPKDESDGWTVGRGELVSKNIDVQVNIKLTSSGNMSDLLDSSGEINKSALFERVYDMIKDGLKDL